MIRRLLTALIGHRCRYCRERTRHLVAHTYVNHTEADPR
jgi:hypothetical protein